MSDSFSEIATLKQAASTLYQQRGFQHKLGYGNRPAVLVIDLALAWTDPQYPLGSNLDAVIAATNEVLAIAREKGLPIVFTTMAYDPKQRTADLYLKKIPALQGMISGSEPTGIDPRLNPQPDELILEKQWLSAFFGTNLVSYLISQQVDTVIITGCSTSACVRATATDALGYGFHSIVPQDCVGDRAAGPHVWNLFDIDAKMGDVVSQMDVLQYLATR
ncbi:isochorismatase family protein [Phormidium tenue FACHB-886]|nr:isochorismatase family protein [Phormidium tenue FACHB-886]